MIDELRKVADKLSRLAAELAAIVDGNHPIKDRFQQFIDEGNIHVVRGSRLPFSEVFAAFKSWLPPQERAQCNKAAVRTILPFETSTGGRSNQPQMMVDDVSFKPAPAPRITAPAKINPDYDEDAMILLVHDLRLRLTYEATVEQLDTLGHRNATGDTFTVDDVKWHEARY